MSKILPAAIAGLAEQFGGQVILELPDELSPSFLKDVVSVANALIIADPAFAWLLVDRRADLEPFQPSCGFRELAQLRQDTRLVVCYASDNRGMSTYTTVYAPLFGPEFPSLSNSEIVTGGVAGIQTLSREVATRICEEIGAELLSDELVDATGSILGLLAESYRQEGNTASSWVSRWWLHAANWADDFVAAAKTGRGTKADIDLLKLIFGVAGLPSPDSGPRFSPKMRREYASVIRDRWASIGGIEDELARLARRPESADGARLLQKIDWAAGLIGAREGAGSLVEAITAAGSASNRAERYSGWASISESSFLSRKVSSSELVILRDGQSLPAPWPGAAIFRVNTDEVDSNHPTVIDVRDITVVVPFLESVLPPTNAPDPKQLGRQLKIEITPGEVASFQLTAVRVSEAGLEIDVAVQMRLPSWTAKAVRIAVAFRGDWASYVGDEVSTRIFLLGPDAVLTLYRRSGLKGKDSKTRAAQILPGLSNDEPEQIELDRGGLYVSAVAIGANALDYSDHVDIKPQRGDSALAPIDSFPWLLRCEPRPLESGDSIECQTRTLFQFQLKSVDDRPLSPLIAACIGVRPSVESRSGLLDQCFGQLERQIIWALRLIESDPKCRTLGHILLSTSASRHEVELISNGYFRSRALGSLGPQKYPPPPSTDLMQLPQYASLVSAYRELGLASCIERAEQQEDSHGLLLSRVSLRDIDEAKIDSLLKNYADLIAAADALPSSTDGFWARFPMSVIAYPDSPAQSNCEAVFPSPAHPIRLAWLWQLENAFAVVREETGAPPTYSRLSEGWTFPWVAGIRARFGTEPMPFVSVPCDSGPDHVFVGWSALVRLSSAESHELRAPPLVNGLRFPAGASSGLTESAVEGALRAFVRVFPQVRTLTVELPAFQRIQRSIGVDTALGDAFRRLTSGEDGQWCLPGGIRVRDSLLRAGPVPHRDEFVRRDPLVSGRRKVEWERFDPQLNTTRESQRVHIRLVESQTAQLEAASVGLLRGAFPRVPLRRFPRRFRHDQGIIIDPSFEVNPPDNRFASAVSACEGVPNKPPFALLVTPGATFGDLASADWTVTGDAGLDPAVLQQIAVANSSRHMLWEWRPAVAVSGESQLEQRPFVTISRIPEAFSASLREKVKLLLPAQEHSNLTARVDGVVRLLAQRGIGLNSLLAMGHQHATGALGFYFALRLLSQWALKRERGETRLIVPVDAVDTFLRAVVNPTTKPLDASKLADLLVISCIQSEGKSIIRLVPVEIKHYGLVQDEYAELFPQPGESRLERHVKQLTDYTGLLKNIQFLKDESSETHGCLIDTAIGAVVDAATMLDSDLQGGDDPVALRNLVSGFIEIQVCPGVLLWFQKGGANASGPSAIWHPEEDSPVLHAKAFVDPLPCWQEVWLNEGDQARTVVEESLSWCLSRKAVVRVEPRTASDTEAEAPAETPKRPSGRVHMAATDRDMIGAKLASLRAISEIPDEPAPATIATPSPMGPTTLPSSPEVPIRSDSTAPSRDLQAGSGVATKAKASVPRKHLSPEELEQRYRVILKTFQEFKVPVHPPEAADDRFTEGPASIVFGIRPGFGVPVGRIESQVANLKLRLHLDDKAKIDFKVHRGLVLLDVPKADCERYYVDANAMWARWLRPESGFSIPLGEDRYGEIVAIDWADSNSPHLLLAGQTGSGKSVALMSILAGAVHYYSPEELRLVLVDPKRVELTTFEGSPYLLTGRIMSEAPEAAEALEKSVVEMEERYQAFAKAGKGITNLDAFNSRVPDNQRKPRWLIVLDEYADLTHDPAAKTTIEASLTRLAQKARAAGIHVLVSTQKPIVDVISTVVRGNLPAQLALRVRSQTESFVILDEGGAEKLTGKGDALLKVGGNVTRLQCAAFRTE